MEYAPPLRFGLKPGNSQRVLPRITISLSHVTVELLLPRKIAERDFPQIDCKRIRIHFQWNRLVASAIQESAHVEFRESRDAKLPILLHMYEFVEQQSVSERLVRDHYVRERDRAPHSVFPGGSGRCPSPLDSIRRLKSSYARQVSILAMSRNSAKDTTRRQQLA